jgi:aspartate aminotransferase
MKVAADAERMRRQGLDVVDLGAGEPDFPTPDHIKAAGRAAIDANHTKYTVNQGLNDLRAAIAERYWEDYHVSYGEAEIIVTNGGKQALYNAMLALFGPGDEVITHAPGWPTIVEQIKLVDATPVVVRAHADEGFALRAETFLAAISPSTRGIVINSPCNPTGALMTEEEFTKVAEICAARGIWLLMDLCYERLIYEALPHNLPKVVATIARDRGVLCGSASKAYAMTGWRCGWAMGPEDLIAACNAKQSHSTSNVCSITQHAAIAAMRGPQDCIDVMLYHYRERRDLVWDLMTADPRIRCAKPSGAFYLFLDVSDLLSPDGLRTSADLARALLEEVHVAVTAGEAFDAPGFVRISYATSTDRLREGAARLSRFIGMLERDGRLAPLGR